MALRLLTPGFITVLLLARVVAWRHCSLPLIVLSTPEIYPARLGPAQWQAPTTARSGANILTADLTTG